MEFDIHTVRDNIGYVAQEPQLVLGTILENIVFGNPEATTKEVAIALETSQLKEWVSSLPEGLETSVFEQGLGISGGEKQRITIARAILRKPDFLILDEASSALDPKTEKFVLNRLISLPWKPGVISITHRHAVTSMFDKVIEL